MLLEVQMEVLWRRLGDHTNWVSISRVSNSFISKATLAFSLSTFVLANFSDVLGSFGIHFVQFRLLLIGAILFMIGNIWVGITIPNELRGATSLDEIVFRMLRISDWHFYKSRHKMTATLVGRISGKEPFDLPEGPLRYARDQIAAPPNKDTWRENEAAAALYHADLTLRQYDMPIKRWIGISFLVSGALFLFVPTITNFVKAIV